MTVGASDIHESHAVSGVQPDLGPRPPETVHRRRLDVAGRPRHISIAECDDVAEGIIGEHEPGVYEVIFLDLNNNPVAIVGDTLTFVIGSAQYFYPYRYILTLADIMSYRATVNMQIVVSVPEAAWGRLGPCYPNPFNPRTTISYSLSATGRARLRLYDAAGKAVRTLVDIPMQGAGCHRAVWDGRDAAGRPVAPGIYFSRLEAGRFSATQRMTLLR